MEKKPCKTILNLIHKSSEIRKGEEANLEIACIYAHFQKTKEWIQT